MATSSSTESRFEILNSSSRLSGILWVMSFLDDLRIEISSDADEEQSDSTLEKPRGRGIAKEWTLLHAFATVEEFMANYPSRDEFYARNKTRGMCYVHVYRNVENGSALTVTLLLLRLRRGLKFEKGMIVELK